MKGRPIDVKHWKRREHYLLYRTYAQPFFSVCTEVDVTRLWGTCHAEGGPSFFLASLYLMLKAANETEAFRLRIRKRGVWQHETIAVGPTVPRADGTFGFARLEAADGFGEFVRNGEPAIAESRTRKTLAPDNEDADDIIYHSTLPWLTFTAFTNALPGGDDSIPRIVFGKCSRKTDVVTMPVAVEVHHAVVDGADVAAFVERFQLELHTGVSLSGGS